MVHFARYAGLDTTAPQLRARDSTADGAELHLSAAASAIAVVMRVTGAPAEPARLIADRPFLYVIHDNAQGAAPTPLFIGRVLDPTV